MIRRTKIAPRSLALAGAMLCASAWSAQAAPTAADTGEGFFHRSTLTGDWGGNRTRLAARGVTIVGSEVVDSVYNTSGGTHDAGRAAGQFLLGVTVDTDKAWDHPGGKLQLTVTNRHGNNLAVDTGMGLLQPMQSIYGRGEIWRLTDFWYEQSFNDGATALKVGRVTHGEDYGVTPCGNISNVILCGPASSQIVGTYLYNSPVSSWGARLRQRIAPELYVHLGVIESNPENLRDSKGFYLGHGGATGTIYAAELQWTPTFGAHHDLPGTYKLGGWYDSSNSDDITRDSNGDYPWASGLAAARVGHHAGVHANVLQQLIAPQADGSHGLSVVANLALADRATNKLRGKAAVILSYTGPLPGRPQDDVTFGVGQVFVNSRVTGMQEAQNSADLRTGSPQRAETAAEVNYGYRVSPAVTLRPGVQFVRNPGGRRDQQDVLAASLKLVFTL